MKLTTDKNRTFRISYTKEELICLEHLSIDLSNYLYGLLTKPLQLLVLDDGAFILHETVAPFLKRLSTDGFNHPIRAVSTSTSLTLSTTNGKEAFTITTPLPNFRVPNDYYNLSSDSSLSRVSRFRPLPDIDSLLERVNSDALPGPEEVKDPRFSQIHSFIRNYQHRISEKNREHHLFTGQWCLPNTTFNYVLYIPNP